VLSGAAIAAESILLPGDPHGNSADRLLIATARKLQITLATRDGAIVAGQARIC